MSSTRGPLPPPTGQPPPVWRGRGAGRAEDGSVSLELSLVAPVVLLLLFGVVQGALYYHARTVALGAAQEGLRAARVEGGSPGAGERRARQFVADAGGEQVLGGLDVRTTGDPAGVRVSVTGRPLSLLPGVLAPAVTQVAAGPRERFTP